MSLRNNFPGVWGLKKSPSTCITDRRFHLLNFHNCMSKLDQDIWWKNRCNLPVTVLFLSLLLAVAVPWKILLQLQVTELFSSKLHYTISEQAIFFHRRLKSAEPCFTKKFAYFSTLQIRQMTLVFFPYHTLPTHRLDLVALLRSYENAGISEINRLVHSYADSQ